MNAKWTERFINLAAEVGSWSKDPSSQVGAVIIRPDRSVASVGFNGLPRGVSDDPARLADRDQKLLYTVHAELNAILAAREPLIGYSIVVYPFQPCSGCAAAIIQAGITEVICPEVPDASRWADSFHAARTMFRESGTVVRWV
jgi:dCMP deaminase